MGTKPRVESGVVAFDDDLPGVFIRGDHAHLYADALRRQLEGARERGEFTLHLGVLDALRLLLESSNIHGTNAATVERARVSRDVREMARPRG